MRPIGNQHSKQFGLVPTSMDRYVYDDQESR